MPLLSHLMFAALVTTLPAMKLDLFVEPWGLGVGMIGVVMGLFMSEPKF